MPGPGSVSSGRTAGYRRKGRLGWLVRSLRCPGPGLCMPVRPAAGRVPRPNCPRHGAGLQLASLASRGPLIGLAPQDQLDGQPIRARRADAGMPGAWRPSLRRAGQSQGRAPVSQHRMRGADAGGRRKHALRHRQNGLDQASDTSRGSRVADVPGDRAEHANPLGASAEHRERRQLGVIGCADRQAAALE